MARGHGLADEPSGTGSLRNPEFVVSTPEARVGVEVKAPALLAHEQQRSSNPLQAAARALTPESLAAFSGDGQEVTLPRDNPLKDFLVNAEGKFAPFHRDDPDFYGLLVVVWDDFIYEPISALTKSGVRIAHAQLFRPRRERLAAHLRAR